MVDDNKIWCTVSWLIGWMAPPLNERGHELIQCSFIWQSPFLPVTDGPIFALTRVTHSFHGPLMSVWNSYILGILMLSIPKEKPRAVS